MSVYSDLQSNLQYDKGMGNSAHQAIILEKDKSEFQSATIQEWSKAIHTTWIETMTLAELINGLTAVGRFTADAIKKEANVYFLEVVIHIDANGILDRKFTYQDDPIFVGNYVTLTSNHVSTTTGQGSNELDCEELVPNESIEWTALCKDGANTIQLKTFHASPINADANFGEIISTPVAEVGSPNKFSSYVKADPKKNFKKAYSFDFTINNGKQVYTFDPWLGDEKI